MFRAPTRQPAAVAARGGRRVGRRLGTSRGVSESPPPPVCAPPRLKPPGTQRSAEGCGMPPGRDTRQLLGASGGGRGDFSEPTSPRTPQSRGLHPTTSAQREMPASKALPHAHETEGLNVLRRCIFVWNVFVLFSICPFNLFFFLFSSLFILLCSFFINKCTRVSIYIKGRRKQSWNPTAPSQWSGKFTPSSPPSPVLSELFKSKRRRWSFVRIRPNFLDLASECPDFVAFHGVCFYSLLF